jgi:superkiller protein 3
MDGNYEASYIKDKIMVKYAENDRINESAKFDKYFEEGIIYGRKGDFQKAVDAFQKAIDLNPDDASVYYNLGITFDNVGDFQKAIDLKPDYASAYYNLGVTLYEMDEIQKDVDAYQKAINLNPDDASAYNNLGLLYLKKSEYEKAVNVIIKGLIENSSSRNLIILAYKICIRQEFWNYIKTFERLWKGQESISTIIGHALAEVILDDTVTEKFYYFKNTLDKIKNDPKINRYDMINALGITLFTRDKNHSILDQIVYELDREKDDDIMLSLILQVFKYLLHPDQYDINQLHPDARSVVESVMVADDE